MEKKKRASRIPAGSSRVTVKKFAEQIGVTATTVETALKSGYLGDAVHKIGTRTEIDPVPALSNWAANSRQTASESPALKKALDPYRKPMSSEEIDKTTRTEADRQAAIYKAKKMKLEFEEAAGLLVPVTEVRTALVTFGQIARVELENLPSRLVDAIDAAPTRHAKMVEAKKEVRKALNFLADLESGEVKLKGGR